MQIVVILILEYWDYVECRFCHTNPGNIWIMLSADFAILILEYWDYVECRLLSN